MTHSSVAKNALIVKLAQIGDVIMVIPAARALYEQGYCIDWACGRAARSILECYSWIRVIPVDDAALLKGGLYDRAKQIAAFWRATGRNTYDLCALAYYDRRYRVLTWPIRAQRKIVLSRSSREQELLPGRHHTDEFVRILLGLPDGCRETSTPPVKPDRLPSCPLPAKTSARRIAIVPGAAGNLLRKQVQGGAPEGLRRWPVENYLALARELLARGWEVVVLGGPDEAWVRPYFAGLAVIDCIGSLSLPEVVSTFNTCDAVVTNDTGPLHLAGLSDTCVLGLFGPTDPAMRIPRRDFSVGLWGGEGFACRPCFDGVEFAPCPFNGCMHQIAPERVLRELDRLLEERGRGAGSPWRIVFPSDGVGAVQA